MKKRSWSAFAVSTAFGSLFPFAAHALVTHNVATSLELQTAFFAAATNNDDDLIVMAAGVYDLAASGGRTTFIPQAADNGDLTLRGAGAGQTVIDSGFAAGPLVLIDYNDGPVVGDAEATVTVEGITFRHGRSDEWPGAGLSVSVTDARVRIVDCAFEANWAQIYGADDGTPPFEGSGAGAFLYSDGNADFLVEGSTFEGNQAESEGGGLLLLPFNGDAVVAGNRFASNHAAVSGAGGFQFRSPSGGLVFADNVVAENIVDAPDPIAPSKAGGVFIELSGGDAADVVNNTFYDNWAAGVGGLVADVGADADLNLFNNLFSANTGAVAGDAFAIGASLAIFNNLAHDVCYGVVACEATIADGFQANLVGVDPLLAAPDAGDFHLLAGSPALEAGSSAAPSLPSEDFEGDARVIGAKPDIGADESRDPPAAPTTGEGTGGASEGNTTGEGTGGEGTSGGTTEGTAGKETDKSGGCSLVIPRSA